MSENITEGYAVTIKDTEDHIFERKIVAVFRDPIFAEMWAKYAYGYGTDTPNNPAQPEIVHVFFGVEAF